MKNAFEVEYSCKGLYTRCCRAEAYFLVASAALAQDRAMFTGSASTYGKYRCKHPGVSQESDDRASGCPKKFNHISDFLSNAP